MDKATVGSTPAAVVTTTGNPEWKPIRTSALAADLQGFAISAYPNLHFASVLMVRFRPNKTNSANAWIAQIAPRITDASGERAISLNLAFSHAGLELLGVASDVLKTFSLPFQEGMTTLARAKFLYDEPSTWLWSDRSDDPLCVHAQLLIYAGAAEDLASTIVSELALLTGFGHSATTLEMQVNIGPNGLRLEHFGFADGISQPVLVDGNAVPARKRALNEIPAGEVILGQINTYDQAAVGPVVDDKDAVAAKVLKASTVEGFRDLGGNGSYLVIRQLKQDVSAFWNNMNTAASNLFTESGEPADAQWLAQKVVGRTMSGAMLAPGAPAPGNDMTFFTEDRYGLDCPITSHVRRANPRDGLSPKAGDTNDMIRATNRHRIMRRGRIYGEPSASPNVADSVDRGLLFMCMNTDIQRQFEFVQHTWLLNPMFGGGYKESDPLLGPACPFSVPSKPLRQRPTIATFITPVGGGYFFLPSLSALHYLGAL